MLPSYTAATLHAFREDPEPDGTNMPLFGWRILHPVSPDTTWDDTVDSAAWNSSLALTGWFSGYDEVPELQPAGFAHLLRQHGIPAVICVRCDEPITNRHPRWEGIWVTPCDTGPLCEEPHGQRPVHMPRFGALTDHSFGSPHRPA